MSSLLILLFSLLVATARAHDAPQGLALVWSETGDLPIVLSNRGLIFPSTGDGVTAFSLRCSEAYGTSTFDVPQLWTNEAGALVLATSRAVRLTGDRGCSFTPTSGLPAESLGPAAGIPSMSARRIISTVAYDREASQLLVSDNHGQNWTVLATSPPATTYTRLVPSRDGQRIYASGERAEVVNKRRKLVPVWATSTDAGKIFLTEDLAAVRVPLGTHPNKPELVIARERIEPEGELAYDYIMRSRDGGATWEMVGRLSSTLWTFASSADGSSLWVAGYAGLYRSRDEGAHFEQMSAGQVLSVQCLVHRQGRLWACATMAPSTPGVWVSDDEGTSWKEVLTFAKVTTPVSCARDVEQRVCELPWQDWTREILSGASAVDAGAAIGDGAMTRSDAGASVDASAPSGEQAATRGDGGGCQVARSHGEPTLLAIAMVALALRRRRSTQASAA